MQGIKATARRHNYIFNKIKPVILFIYGYRCIFCNVFDYGNHVHHIDKIHTNNNPFNLTCLCEPCHKMAHSKLKINYPQVAQHQKKMLGHLLFLFSKSVL